MKKLVLTLLVLGISSVSFAQENLGLSGFQILSNDSDAMEIKHQGGTHLLISKEKFISQAAAEEFCKKKGGKLDHMMGSLLIAMSGAALANDFLKESITFEIKHNGKKAASGLWMWTPKLQGQVVLLMDGSGSDEKIMTVDELKPYVNVQIPAICEM